MLSHAEFFKLCEYVKVTPIKGTRQEYLDAATTTLGLQIPAYSLKQAFDATGIPAQFVVRRKKSQGSVNRVTVLAKVLLHLVEQNPSLTVNSEAVETLRLLRNNRPIPRDNYYWST